MHSILLTFWNLKAIDLKSLEPPDLEDSARLTRYGLPCIPKVLSKFNLDVNSLYLNSKLHSILLPA